MRLKEIKQKFKHINVRFKHSDFKFYHSRKEHPILGPFLHCTLKRLLFRCKVHAIKIYFSDDFCFLKKKREKKNPEAFGKYIVIYKDIRNALRL